MTFAYVIGIDPGKAGGLSLLNVGSQEVQAVKMPQDENDLLEALENFMAIDAQGLRLAVIEKVASSPQMGVKSAFTFGEGFGLLKGVLAAKRIPREFITPAVWQRALGVPKRAKDESQTVHKNRLKQRANEVFPNNRWTLATCDAALLALYGARRWAGLDRDLL